MVSGHISQAAKEDGSGAYAGYYARLEFTASRSGETLKLSVRHTPVPISSVSMRVQTMNSSCVAETWPQYTDTKLNLRHRGLLKQERIV